ncbi:hypothetical protein DFH06DRAFT_1142577 [Mycena polygramma]|nr:hypothetical protein DFH06DRAFT_1142577 [Mycena polygramma]
MSRQPTLASIALGKLSRANLDRVQNYLNLADHEPAPTPPRRRVWRSAGSTDAAGVAAHGTSGLAASALSKLSRRKRDAVQTYLALVDHEPTTPPKKCARLPAVSRARAAFLLVCFFEDNEAPRNIFVPSVNIEAGFVKLAGLDLGQTEGAQLQMLKKMRSKAQWTTIAHNLTVPRKRGSKAFVLRWKHVVLIDTWHSQLENTSAEGAQPTVADRAVDQSTVFVLLTSALTHLQKMLLLIVSSQPIFPKAYINKDCAHHFKHTINFILGLQQRTREKIGVYETHCPGKPACAAMISDTWPAEARTELHYLLSEYIKLTKLMKEGTGDKAALAEQMNILQARRDEFPKKQWGASNSKRPAEDSGEEEATDKRQRKKPKSPKTTSSSSAAATIVEGKNTVEAQKTAPATSGPATTGKGKQQVIQYDKFDPDTYVLDSSEELMIEVIVYNLAGSPPLETTLQLRHAGGLDLASMDFAADVRGIETAAGPALDFDWFCVFEKDFLPGAFTTTINMLPRGRFLVCRSATVLESECPRLQDWIDKSYASLVGLAAAYRQDSDWEEEDDMVSWDAIPSSQLVPPSSSVPFTSSAPSGSSSAALGPSGSSSSRKKEAPRGTADKRASRTLTEDQKPSVKEHTSRKNIDSEVIEID